MKIPPLSPLALVLITLAVPALAEDEARRAERAIREAQAAAERARQDAERARPAHPGTPHYRDTPEFFIKGPPRSAANLAQTQFEQAQALERNGNGPGAVKLYISAARGGSGKAALRLAEIYDKGIADVPRDYPESLKWRNAARLLGEDVAREKTK